MSRLDRTARTTSFAATATTLAALVAMAAAAPHARGLHLPRATHVEVAALGEARTIRAVAAVVAAAARDLLTGHTTAALCPGGFPRTVAGAAPVVTTPRHTSPRPTTAPVLDERLIDLPPPRC